MTDVLTSHTGTMEHEHCWHLARVLPSGTLLERCCVCVAERARGEGEIA